MIENKNMDPTSQPDGPLKSIQGWIIIVTGLHEETQEDDIYDQFSKFGPIRNLHLNLDRRTAYVKGYALIEFEKYEQAAAAIAGKNGQQIYDKKIQVDWAFKKPPPKKERHRDHHRKH